MALFPPRRLLTLLFALLLAGCAQNQTQSLGTWVGPTTASDLQLSTAHYTDADVTTVSTAHYTIYSTMTDQDFLRQIGQLMEGAYPVYQSIAPGIPETDRPMICYLFATRAQWADFTRKHAGSDSSIYLHIHQGGYTRFDQYVAYYFGDGATCSVAAHEGWHQYVARHFKGRLPPFIEEGIATTFEGVQFVNGLPRFNRSINQDRALSLRKAIEDKDLWTLSDLLQMHAGNVITLTNGRIMAFYAEAWAFARFLWEADNGKYRPAFQKMLLDIATGNVWDPSGSFRSRLGPWIPAASIPMLEHYLNEPLSQIDAEYSRYIQSLAYDELPEQSENAQ
jgi:hypothetical protein